MKVEIDKKAMRKFEKGLAGVWEIPAEVSESEAVASVRKQMRASGLDPSSAEVRKIVREARKSVQ